MYEYDEAFYEYISQGSRRSAEVVVPYLLDVLELETVLDVGCGAGAWLEIWKRHGVNVEGLDGDYVHSDMLLIDQEEFITADLSKPFDLKKKYSIVQSLEVAEHIPLESAQTFISCLCAHGEIILFSAAPPGQGGDNHINEQPYSFWQEIFLKNGYVALDLVRPELLNNNSVEKWYRYNTVMYVSKERLLLLPKHIADSLIEGPVQDISPKLYRFRKFLIRNIPLVIATKIAKVKEHMYIRYLRLAGRLK
ncbi:MAG: SAM-dependent methyltransferase [Bermanella sp.]|jgi:SAM-dependent methyltransferase